MTDQLVSFSGITPSGAFIIDPVPLEEVARDQAVNDVVAEVETVLLIVAGGVVEEVGPPQAGARVAHPGPGRR